MKDWNEVAEAVRAAQPVIVDFPHPGVNFIDLWGLTKDPVLTHEVANWHAEQFSASDFDVILAPESRGFGFGQLTAYLLGKPFVPARKPGKLPRPSVAIRADVEYCQTSLEIHREDIAPGARVVIIDDLFATGGTVMALIELLERQFHSRAVGVATINSLDYLPQVELPEYCERRALVHYPVPPVTLGA